MRSNQIMDRPRFYPPGSHSADRGGRSGFRGGQHFGNRQSFRVEADESERENGPTDIEKRLEFLIAGLGERRNAALENNIKNLAKVLLGDIANFKDTILTNLVRCATTMPEKITIYTSLAAVLNADNYAFGGEFVDQLRRNLETTIESSDFQQAELTLRVIADCANCNLISVSCLIMIFEALLEALYDNDAPQARGDWYAYLVLSAMPWIGEKMNASKPDELKKILEDILSYITRRKETHLADLRIIRSDDPLPQEDYLDSLWTQVEDLKNRQWREKHILRPYIALESTFSRGQVHNISQVFPAAHEESSRYPLPKVVFRLFDFTDCPEGTTLPPLNSIERFLIEDDLGRIIRNHHDDRRVCAAALLNYPASQPNIPLDYMIIEVILGQLMQLPKSPHREVFYGSMILELCKLRQYLMLPTLALAISLLYERVEHLNVSSLHSLAFLIAYHLSNYEFRWTWGDWNDSLQLDKDHPRAKFVTEILENCITLSCYSRVVDSVPPRFKVFLPEEPYLEQTVSGCTQALEFHEAVRDKKDDDQSEVERRITVNHLRGVWKEFLERPSDFTTDLEYERVASGVSQEDFEDFCSVYGRHVELLWQDGFVIYSNPSSMHERAATAFDSVLLPRLRRHNLDKHLIATRSAAMRDVTGYRPFRDRKNREEFVQKEPDLSHAPVNQRAAEPQTLAVEIHYTNVGPGGTAKDVELEGEWFIKRAKANIYIAIAFERAAGIQARIKACAAKYHPETSSDVDPRFDPTRNRNVPPTRAELAGAERRLRALKKEDAKAEVDEMFKDMEIWVHIQTADEPKHVFLATAHSTDHLSLPVKLLLPKLPAGKHPATIQLPVAEIYAAIQRDCLAPHLFI